MLTRGSCYLYQFRHTIVDAVENLQYDESRAQLANELEQKRTLLPMIFVQQMSSDTYVCSVCHIKVKTKLARAHEKGAKHVAKLRAQTTPKRPAPSATIEESATFKKRTFVFYAI